MCCLSRGETAHPVQNALGTTSGRYPEEATGVAGLNNPVTSSTLAAGDVSHLKPPRGQQPQHQGVWEHMVPPRPRTGVTSASGGPCQEPLQHSGVDGARGASAALLLSTAVPSLSSLAGHSRRTCITLPRAAQSFGPWEHRQQTASVNCWF